MLMNKMGLSGPLKTALQLLKEILYHIQKDLSGFNFICTVYSVLCNIVNI